MDIHKFKMILEKAWCQNTCYEKLREKWNKNNAAIGQCYVSSMLFHDIFGGEIFKIKLNNGISHYFNRLNGIDYDFTKSQFIDEKFVGNVEHVDREFMELNDRYFLLRNRFEFLSFKK